MTALRRALREPEYTVPNELKNATSTLLTRHLIYHKPNTSGTCAGTTIGIQQTQMTASSISGRIARIFTCKRSKQAVELQCKLLQ